MPTPTPQGLDVVEAAEAGHDVAADDLAGDGDTEDREQQPGVGAQAAEIGLEADAHEEQRHEEAVSMSAALPRSDRPLHMVMGVNR
jgi:hypothetical protein